MIHLIYNIFNYLTSSNQKIILKSLITTVNLLTKLKILIITLFAISIGLFAQMHIIPMSIQIPIFLKILTFDRNFQQEKEIDILIAYQSKFLESVKYAEETYSIIKNTDSKLLRGIKLNPVLVNLDYESKINSYVNEKKHTVIILMPLKALSIKNLSNICLRKKILTFSTDPTHLEDGISIALEERRNKPEIWINLENAKKEGADFSSQLLKIVKIKDKN